MLSKFGMVLVGLIAIALLLVPARIGPGSLIWNFTPSTPIGLYRIDQKAWSRDDRVAVKPSGKLAGVLSEAGVVQVKRLLIKRVAAVAGDKVCRHGADVQINDVVVVQARLVDPERPALPQWLGCRLLEAGEVFLLGETENSFDGRYFGVSDTSDILGRVAPVLLLAVDR